MLRPFNMLIGLLIFAILGLPGAVRGDAFGSLPPPQCPPLIRGALWWVQPKTDGENLERVLAAMADVGMNVLWLLGTPPLLEKLEDDLLERIFTQADQRGWRVIIETSCVGDWFHKWDIDNLKTIDRRQMEEVTRRFGHHPSFFAWYINYEIYMEWDEKSRKIRELYRHIREIARQITPGKKVCVSPFFLADEAQIRAPFRYATPGEYGDWWGETIRQAGIDIVMLQDSGAEHCECVPLNTRAAFFAAMQRACRANQAELWGNVETVEYQARDWKEYAERLMHFRETKTEYPWSFDMARNAIKLDLASRFSTNIVTWGWEFWNPAAPQDRVGNSADNYRAYLAYYRDKSGRTASTRPQPVGSQTVP